MGCTILVSLNGLIEHQFRLTICEMNCGTSMLCHCMFCFCWHAVSRTMISLDLVSSDSSSLPSSEYGIASIANFFYLAVSCQQCMGGTRSITRSFGLALSELCMAALI